MFMAQAYQLCAGVGYGRKSGFRYESYIVAVIEKRQQRLHFFRFGMLVKFMKLKLLYMSFQSGCGEIPSGCPRRLHYVCVKLRQY